MRFLQFCLSIFFFTTQAAYAAPSPEAYQFPKYSPIVSTVAGSLFSFSPDLEVRTLKVKNASNGRTLRFRYYQPESRSSSLTFLYNDCTSMHYM